MTKTQHTPETPAELDRLKEINAKLVDALDGMVWLFEQIAPRDWCKNSGHLWIAKDVLTKARGRS